MTRMSNSKTIKRRRLHSRGLTSFVVVLSFLAMAISGVVLYVAPRVRDANWGGWTCVNLRREQWLAMHIVISTLFMFFGALHLCFNWRPLWSYAHSRLRRGINLWKELLAAGVLVVGLSAAAVMGLSPTRQLVQGSDYIKDYWAGTLPRAPFPHAELLTLEDIQQRTGVFADDLAQTLRDSGFRVGGMSDSLLQVAEANGATPAVVFDVMRKEFQELGSLTVGGRGRGKGRMQGLRLRRTP